MLPKKNDEGEKEQPTLGEDVKEIMVSFSGAGIKAVSSLFYLPIEAEKEEDTTALNEAVKGHFTPLSAFAFMAFVLLYMPCMVVVAAMRQEFGTWRWAGMAALYSTLLAWVVAFLVYQGGMLLGLGG